MEKKISELFREHEEVLKLTHNLKNEIIMACDLIIKTFKQGNKVLICGNGGSASDAQHMAGELVARFKINRKGLPAIALTTDTSIITAWSNDIGFETVFSRQVEALGKKDDLLISISTSGNSANCIKADEEAKRQDMKIINLLGGFGGKIKGSGDVEIIIPTKNTPRVQEMHGLIIHMICEIVEAEMSD